MQTIVQTALYTQKAGVHDQLGDSGLEIDVLAQLFDLIDYPIILIDNEAALIWKNRQGQQALIDGHCLVIRDQIVGPSSQGYGRRWHERLLAASMGEEALLFIDDGELGQAVSINPLPNSKIEQAAGEPPHYARLVIIIGKKLPCEPLTLRRFSGTYKITAAEQRVVAQLMKGLAPCKIALNNDVAETTVRTQIKSVLAKTGISSMRDLLLRLSRLPPVSMAR